MKHSNDVPRFFDAPKGPPPAPHNGTPTSKAAAASVEPRTPSMQNRVFFFIKNRPEGATCEEVEIGLGLKHQTAAARIRGLVQQGSLHDSGKTRNTTSGRKAIVWSAVPKGLD